MPVAHAHMQRRSMLRVQQLDMFLHLVESRSVSTTAELMCLTQSAVTKSLKGLEAHFGASFFDRTSRGLVITDSGKVMERYAESVVLGFELVSSDIHGTRSGSARAERIGCTPDVGQDFVVRLVAALRAQGANSRMLVQINRSDMLIESLRRDELDYAVLHASSDVDTATFDYVAVGEERLGLAVRPEHPMASADNSAELSAHILLAMPWVLPAINSPTCRNLRESLMTMGLPFPTDVVHASCPATVVDLAVSLDMVALMPVVTVESLSSRNVLRQLASPFRLPPMPFGVTYAKRASHEPGDRRPAIRQLLQLVESLNR